MAILKVGGKTLTLDRSGFEYPTEVVEDVPLGIGPATFEFFELGRDGEPWTNGQLLLARARNLKTLAGERHAQLFLAHQERIPEEERGHFLVFSGTKRRNHEGKLEMPYLAWCGGKWNLYWALIGEEWNALARFVRIRE